MVDRRSDVQVGLFAVIGISLLAMLIFVFGGFKNVFARTYDVTAWFQNAGGATEGTPVRLLGIEIGRVKGIKLAADKKGVEMKLEINSNVDVSADAPLAIKQEGFIANIYLEFGGGSETAALPKDGKAYVKGNLETFAFYFETAATTLAAKSSEIGNKVTEVAVKLVSLADNLTALTGDEAFRKDIKDLTSSSKEVAAKLKEKLPDLIDNLNLASKGAKESMEKASKLFDEYQVLGQGLQKTNAAVQEQVTKQGANLDQLSAALIQAANDIAKLSSNLNDVAVAVKSGQGTVGKAFTDPSLYDRTVQLIDILSGTSKEIKDLAETIKNHPDWLIKGRPKNK